MIRYAKYGLYMFFLMMKDIRCRWIKFRGNEKKLALYVGDTAKKWSKFTLDTIGLDVEVEGLENIPKEPCVFIGNHSSILDVPILLSVVDNKVAFIAKKEVLKTPVLGSWLKWTRSIPLDRDNPRSAVQTINEGVNRIAEGYSMVIFPEGTRNKSHNAGEFKKGSFKLATKSKAPIVPVSIDRASRFYEDNKRFCGGKVKIVFGQAVDTENLSRNEESEMIEEVVETILNNLYNSND